MRKTRLKELKYEKAWDNLKQTWVLPEDIHRAEAHDRNRYFSEQFKANEDKGKVLTLHKQSKTYKNKNGLSITRKAHFCAIADNTKEYRKQTAEKIIRQESLVHKLCKEVIKELDYIKIPSVTGTLLNQDLQIIPEQYIKIKLKSIEKKDKETGRIPDAIVETIILGKTQELYIEFFYKHEIDETKRKQYSFYNINCLEIDLSDLQDNLDETEKTLRNKIKAIISEKAYWINNRAKNIFENTATDEYIVTINAKNDLLYQSKYYGANYNKFYIFKDKLQGIPETHPCYFNASSRKSTDIGECAHCPNCIYIHNYNTIDINNITVYCRRDGAKAFYNPAELISKIYNHMISLL